MSCRVMCHHRYEVHIIILWSTLKNRTVGASYITDTFFLHQRGKCFAFYNVSILLG
jgi:hypothetical protein